MDFSHLQLFDCRNHIRVVQPMDANRLYICGTNAHNPKDYIVFVSFTQYLYLEAAFRRIEASMN